jgi:membrane-bound serine protease (ClpP class)
MKENDYTFLIGKIAVTNSEMSPKGTILIDDEVYEAESEGEAIDPGRGVKVVKVRGKRIIVKRV